eukprot:7614491-Pyramimonas_sp.AAC.1
MASWCWCRVPVRRAPTNVGFLEVPTPRWGRTGIIVNKVFGNNNGWIRAGADWLGASVAPRPRMRAPGAAENHRPIRDVTGARTHFSNLRRKDDSGVSSIIWDTNDKL